MPDKADIEILRLMADGMTLTAIARQLELSERTVRRRVRAVCDELELSQPIEAVVWAVRKGIV